MHEGTTSASGKTHCFSLWQVSDRSPSAGYLNIDSAREKLLWHLKPAWKWNMRGVYSRGNHQAHDRSKMNEERQLLKMYKPYRSAPAAGLQLAAVSCPENSHIILLIAAMVFARSCCRLEVNLIWHKFITVVDTLQFLSGSLHGLFFHKKTTTTTTTSKYSKGNLSE